MRTIFYYGIDNVYGGIENFSYTLIKGITQKTDNINFHIVSLFDDFAFKKELVELGCTFTILPNKKKHPIKFYKKLKELLSNACENDLFQINAMSYRNFLVFKAAKKSKIKTIIVGHGAKTDNLLNLLIHTIFKKFYSQIGTKIAVNEDVIPFMFSRNNNVKVINNGINIEQFKYKEESRDEIRNKLGLSKDDIAIGQIGRLSKQKNQIFSCKVMETLQNNPNIHLFLIGKNQNNKVLSYINKKQIKNIHYLGETANTEKYYSAFDLFIMPSLGESAGISLYEAIANGCPSIISPNVPTPNIGKACLKTLNLNIDLWKNEILSFKQTKRIDADATILDSQKQIIEYFNLYNSL